MALRFLFPDPDPNVNEPAHRRAAKVQTSLHIHTVSPVFAVRSVYELKEGPDKEL